MSTDDQLEIEARSGQFDLRTQDVSAGLSCVINEQLSETAFFLFPSDEINSDDLIDSISKLEVSWFDFNEYYNIFNELIKNNASVTFSSIIAKSQQQLSLGKIQILDEENKPIWISVPKDTRSKFSKAISDISIDENIELFEQEIPVQIEYDEFNNIIDNVGKGVLTKVNDLVKNIPTIEKLISSENSELRLFLELESSGGSRKAILKYEPKNRTFHKINQKIIKVVESLDEYTENPASFAAKQVFENFREKLNDEIYEIANEIILKVNTELYTSLSSDELKPKIRHLPLILDKSEFDSKNNSDDDNSIIDIGEIQQSPESFAISSEEISEVSISLPWIEGGGVIDSTVTEISNKFKSLYILYAMEDKFQNIAEETLSKGLSNKIYGAISNQANLMFDGNMPWEHRSSNIKKLKKDVKAPDEYRNEKIWYTYDLRPNAPRVYFIVKKASEIEVSNDPVLDPQAMCMIIVAITDKKQQLTVLKRLTGKDQDTLVAEGAGSI